MKFLYKCRISITNSAYTLNGDSQYGRHTVVFRGSEEGFKLFLRRIGAKDGESLPRSGREKTYQQIIDEVKSGKTPHIYVWSNRMPKDTVIKESTEIDLKSFLFEENSAKDFINKKYKEVYDEIL